MALVKMYKIKSKIKSFFFCAAHFRDENLKGGEICWESGTMQAHVILEKPQKSNFKTKKIKNNYNQQKQISKTNIKEITKIATIVTINRKKIKITTIDTKNRKKTKIVTIVAKNIKQKTWQKRVYKKLKK